NLERSRLAAFLPVCFVFSHKKSTKKLQSFEVDFLPHFRNAMRKCNIFASLQCKLGTKQIGSIFAGLLRILP
ncbi:MAG TPA: hypothetical protein PLR39_00595, partial [Treponemataceae bacterium]|nr:hypothetical protein [Treponemataceae bacterium]